MTRVKDDGVAALRAELQREAREATAKRRIVKILTQLADDPTRVRVMAGALVLSRAGKGTA